MQYFRQDPQPFYTLAQSLYPGEFKPTLTHTFIRLMQERAMLLRCFTQNIDTLERIAGVQEDLIVEAHGSFANSRCIECRKAVSSPGSPSLLRPSFSVLSFLCNISIHFLVVFVWRHFSSVVLLGQANDSFPMIR